MPSLALGGTVGHLRVCSSALSGLDPKVKKQLVSSEPKGRTQVSRDGRSQGREDSRQRAALESVLII